MGWLPSDQSIDDAWPGHAVSGEGVFHTDDNEDDCDALNAVRDTHLWRGWKASGRLYR